MFPLPAGNASNSDNAPVLLATVFAAAREAAVHTERCALRFGRISNHLSIAFTPLGFDFTEAVNVQGGRERVLSVAKFHTACGNPYERLLPVDNIGNHDCGLQFAADELGALTQLLEQVPGGMITAVWAPPEAVPPPWREMVTHSAGVPVMCVQAEAAPGTAASVGIGPRRNQLGLNPQLTAEQQLCIARDFLGRGRTALPVVTPDDLQVFPLRSPGAHNSGGDIEDLCQQILAIKTSIDDNPENAGPAEKQAWDEMVKEVALAGSGSPQFGRWAERLRRCRTEVISRSQTDANIVRDRVADALLIALSAYFEARQHSDLTPTA